MKKHIIIVASHYPPHIGGIETYSQSLAKEFLERKYKVSVVTTNLSFAEFKTTEEGIDVYRLSSFLLMNKRMPLPYSLSQLIDIGSQVFTRGSVCIIQTRFFPLSLLAGIICQLRGVRCIVVEHGSGHFSYPSLITTKLAAFYEHIVTALLTMIAQPTYVAVSHAAATWLEHFGLKSKMIVCNAPMSSLPAGRQSRTSHNMIRDPEWIPGQARNDRTILYAGRLIKEKGILELIKGFKIFVTKHPIYRLVILGDGELTGEIINESTNNGNISYVGALSHEDTMNWMQHASLYIHPSYYPEGLPTSLLEAGAYEIPVIASHAGGSAELITHMKTGYALSEISPESINEALSYMITHPKEAKAMGSSLYNKIKDTYNWTTVTDRFEKIIGLSSPT